MCETVKVAIGIGDVRRRPNQCPLLPQSGVRELQSMSAFGGKAEITAQRSMIFDPKPTITFDAPCRLQLCGKFRVCVFASCITAVRWDMVGSTGRITQYPTKAAISSKPAGSCISISELAENEGLSLPQIKSACTDGAVHQAQAALRCARRTGCPSKWAHPCPTIDACAPRCNTPCNI
jgi:hypothetical protein